MEMTCLGSSSDGNSYVLHNGKESLVLDAGVRFLEVKRALDFNIKSIVGVLCTHSHLDHIGYASEYIKAGIPVYTNDEAHKSIEIISGELARAMLPNKAYKLGGFTVQPFELVHDVMNFGFLIKHEELGKLLYITDTEYVPQNFASLGVNHVLVECNYCQALVDENYLQSLRNRVISTHMSLETCKDFVQSINSASLLNVCLIHLSSGNGDGTMFHRAIQDITSADVTVATKNLTINLDLCPF